MKKLLFVVVLYALAGNSAHAQQDRYTSKTIFANYKAAIVQILASGNLRGTGFVVSANRIITANHVVNDRQSADYVLNIEVKLNDGKLIKVNPVLAAPSQDSKSHDFAILSTAEPIKPPYLKLGTWTEVVEGDQLTTGGYPFNSPIPLLLSVTVSGRLPLPGSDAIVFQGPNNKGLSGAPLISNRTGNVVGIVNNKIVGITKELQDMRETIQTNAPQGNVLIMGVDPNKAILGLTNVLDDFLISGMGVAIAIDYAKALMGPPSSERPKHP